MFISTLRSALGILASALVFTAAPASAATFTFNDDNCSDFAIGGGPGARTITCLVLAAPVCTPTASPAAGTFGSPVTIAANCTNQPLAAGYVWTGGSCSSSTGLTCADTQTGTAATPVTYTVRGTNNVGPSVAAGQVVVNWSSLPPAPPPPPTGCTLTANPSGLTASGVVLLNAACSGGAAPTNYAWTSTPSIAGFQTATTAPTNTQSITVPATTTFTMTAYNGSAAATQASVTVNVGALSSVPATCGSYAVLNLGVLPRTGNPIFSSGFTGSKIAIATLNVTASSSTGVNTLAVYEYGAAPTNRKAWLSKTVCDTSGVYPYYQSAQGPVFNYSIGGVSSGAVNMQAGETWYLMIRNEKPFGGSSCTSGACDIGIKWYPN